MPDSAGQQDARRRHAKILSDLELDAALAEPCIRERAEPAADIEAPRLDADHHVVEEHTALDADKTVGAGRAEKCRSRALEPAEQADVAIEDLLPVEMRAPREVGAIAAGETIIPCLFA